MRAALVLVAVLAILGILGIFARADDRVTAFSRVQELGRSWQFEVVEGKSIATLAPVKDAPASRCTVVAWPNAPATSNTMIECRVDAKAPANAPNALAPTIKIVFDPPGNAREVRQDSEVTAPTRLYPFTFPPFPPEPTKPWSNTSHPVDGVISRVTVRQHKVAIGGTTVTAWLAESSQATKPSPVRGAAIYHPGHGPILLCPQADDRGYRCLRRTQLDPKDQTTGDPLFDGTEAPPPPQPQARISLVSKQAQDKSSLKADAVAAKLASAYMAGVSRCYRDVLRKKPTAGGALKLTFTVNAVGKTEDPTATGLDPVAGCVRGLMASWRFPIPMSEYGEPRTARFTIGLNLSVR